MGRLKPIDLIPNNSGKIESHYGVFEITETVSDRISMLLEHKNLGDCHFFAWGVATGTIALDTGKFNMSFLEKYGLESVGVMEFVNDKREFNNLEHRKRQVSDAHLRTIVLEMNEEEGQKELARIEEKMLKLEEIIDFERPYSYQIAFERGRRLNIGDILVKHESDHHSMIYLGKNKKYGPIFLSMIGYGDLSIHTFGQITEYYYTGAYHIFREKNRVNMNEEAISIKRKLAKGDYSPFLSNLI